MNKQKVSDMSKTVPTVHTCKIQNRQAKGVEKHTSNPLAVLGQLQAVNITRVYHLMSATDPWYPLHRYLVLT